MMMQRTDTIQSLNFPETHFRRFQCSLDKSLPHECDAVGAYTLGALEYALNFLSDAQLEIRSKFLEFA